MTGSEDQELTVSVDQTMNLIMPERRKHGVITLGKARRFCTSELFARRLKGIPWRIEVLIREGRWRLTAAVGILLKGEEPRDEWE